MDAESPSSDGSMSRLANMVLHVHLKCRGLTVRLRALEMAAPTPLLRDAGASTQEEKQRQLEALGLRTGAFSVQVLGGGGHPALKAPRTVWRPSLQKAHTGMR